MDNDRVLSRPDNFRGAFRQDFAARAIYSEAAGIGRAVPAAVAVPVDAADVSVLARWATSDGVTLIPRGSGSSMAGGAIGPGVVVDLSLLRGIEEPRIEERALRCDAGLTRDEIDARAAQYGLRFPVDPSSGRFCTIGGMVAANAAGAHSLKYGAVRPWVQAIECVFADGSQATIRRGAPPPLEIPAIRRFAEQVGPRLLALRPLSHERVRKDSSGYAIRAYQESRELIDILVGSEGTLAMFVSFEIALIPGGASATTLLVSFPTLDAAAEAAGAMAAAGAAACELLDRTFLTLAATGDHRTALPDDTDAALLVEFESADPAEAMDMAMRANLALRGIDSNAVAVLASSPQAGTELWSLRHAASPVIARLDPRLRSMQFIEDAAVPPESLASYVSGVREILRRHETRGVIFGHAGDAHVHVNPLIDVGRSDWRRVVDRILSEVTELVVKLKGTLCGEHGDGRLRTPLHELAWSLEERNAFSMIKNAFDPNGVLNGGVKVPLPGQVPIEDVKYDPQLPGLPEAVAKALGVVERERGYARHRLAML